MAMSSGRVNTTELVAALINEKEDLVSGIRHAQEQIDGSMTLLLMTGKGEILAARDLLGRLPVLIGENRDNINCTLVVNYLFYRADNITPQ